ncbi:MAG TPA: hypothetical protein VEK76_03665, partial [Candidatus Binatia bacterium]|nr:hypothetical protein [Candidatus Binatia bacterium]
AVLSYAGSGRLVAACGGSGAAGSSDKAVVASPDGGRNWSQLTVATFAEPGARSYLLLGGDLGSLAARGQALVLAASSGGSELETSEDDGATWVGSLSVPGSGGTPWTTLTFLTGSEVLAVSAAPTGMLDECTVAEVCTMVPSGVAYLSHDAAATWTELLPPG